MEKIITIIICILVAASAETADRASIQNGFRHFSIPETAFFNAPSLLTIGASDADEPASDSNYLNLSISPTEMDSGEEVTLLWNADPVGWGFEGVPVDVYLGLKMDPTAADSPSTVDEVVNEGGNLYLFSADMQILYGFTGRVIGPTFENVVLQAGASGDLDMALSAPSTEYSFVAVLVRKDNGQYVRGDYPVENSPPLSIQ
ncbi:MAG: hypothetical protein NTZ78_08840 [Candidatus Aureabacteria bacterium]|nr:hypothetical protein [Candidatus Auribacterota bacterium]